MPRLPDKHLADFTPCPVRAFSDVAAGFSPLAPLQHCNTCKDRVGKGVMVDSWKS